LGTLLGLDDRPGEVAGWGPVPASVARALVARQQRCAWRFGVHDEGGWLVFDGLTRRRAMPAGAVPLGADAGADAGSRGAEGGPTGGGAPKVDGVVEIHLPLDWVNAGGGSPFVLPTSVSDPSGWTAVLADIAGQVATAGPIVQDAAARFPGRPLRRRTEMVYRWCLFPGCRRPARWCDIDHRTEWARGGRTVEINLGPECRHDHVNKSERGWRLIRTGPRSFCWISPYRRRHHVQAPRLVEPALTPPRTPGPGATTRSGAGQDGIDGSDGYDGSGPAVNPAGEPSIWAHDVPADGGRRSTVDGAEPGRPTAEREVDDEAAPF
ncbi:MAG: HNH endonuclease signature motif containing protein, partial [Jatrophihabitans sp.]|uniref:HNH endonuclease signature motif containing protein n=1 Tax=Jatrophihabitans sp. TaxID=1932789 RepID=UPI003F807E56